MYIARILVFIFILKLVLRMFMLWYVVYNIFMAQIEMVNFIESMTKFTDRLTIHRDKWYHA